MTKKAIFALIILLGGANPCSAADAKPVGDVAERVKQMQLQALTREDLDDLAGCEKIRREIIKLTPLDSAAWLDLANIQLERKQVPQALQTLNDAIKKLGPSFENKSLYRKRGELYESMGKDDQALADLNLAVKLGGQAAALECDIRGRYFQHHKQWREALNDYNSSLRMFPGRTQTMARRAEVNKKLGNYAAAEQDLKAIGSYLE